MSFTFPFVRRILSQRTYKYLETYAAIASNTHREGKSHMPAILDAEESAEASAAAIQTTLYDLMYALQDAAEPGDEDLVITAVLHLLRSGRLTFLRAVDDLAEAWSATAEVAHA
jgi:hypothetical protein